MPRSLPRALGKSRVFGLIALALLGSLVFSGQEWFVVSMSPNDEAVTLKSFDGYTTFAWLSPLILVASAAFATSAISSGKTRLASLIAGLFAAAGAATFSITSVLRQDLSGVAREIESATGIAATHGITGLQIATQSAAWLAIGVYLLLVVCFLIAILAQGAWVPAKRPPRTKVTKPVKDSISLWDEQR